MKKAIIHTVGISSLFFIIATWWLFFYRTPFKEASLQQDASFVEKESVEFIFTGSLLATLLKDAHATGLHVRGFSSNDPDEHAVTLQAEAQGLFDILNFFSVIGDHLPSVECTKISLHKKKSLELDARFVARDYIVTQPIIVPDASLYDPFTDESILGYGRCGDGGISFTIKKQGDTIIVEKK